MFTPICSVGNMLLFEVEVGTEVRGRGYSIVVYCHFLHSGQDDILSCKYIQEVGIKLLKSLSLSLPLYQSHSTSSHSSTSSSPPPPHTHQSPPPVLPFRSRRHWTWPSNAWRCHPGHSAGDWKRGWGRERNEQRGGKGY